MESITIMPPSICWVNLQSQLLYSSIYLLHGHPLKTFLKLKFNECMLENCAVPFLKKLAFCKCNLPDMGLSNHPSWQCSLMTSLTHWSVLPDDQPGSLVSATWWPIWLTGQCNLMCHTCLLLWFHFTSFYQYSIHKRDGQASTGLMSLTIWRHKCVLWDRLIFA